ncbi:MAG: ATP-dependent helicase [Methanolobus sp.]|nr:ATP-dependent helicase [Methanolobus sp.]
MFNKEGRMKEHRYINGAELITNFKNYFPDANVFSLPTTYRCARTICEAGNRIAAKIDQTVINTANKSAGKIIKLPIFDTQSDEAEFVCKQAIKIFKGTNQTIKILYRTNAQSVMFQLFLIRQNIPFSINQNNSIFNTKEVKLAIACCRFVTEYDSLDIDSKANTINDMRPLLSPYSKKLLYGTLTDMRKSETDILTGELDRKHEPVLNDLEDIMEMLAGKKPMQIVNAISKMDCMKDFSDSAGDNLIGIAEFLKYCKNMTEIDNLIAEISRPRCVPAEERVISLSTVHGSKGLEADNVFVTGLSDDIFPHILGTKSEELNLIYVAITRARESLYLSGFSSFGDNTYNKHSYMEMI